MNTVVEILKVEAEDIEGKLCKALERLDKVDGEMNLDFSALRRIDAEGLRAMEELAGLAESKKIKLVLRAVNPDVYKVLKLRKLASRFSYLD